MPNTQLQNRMNRKLGITTNGSAKSDQKNAKETTDATKKRQTIDENESEEDSKSKLVTKKAKKTESLNASKQVKTNPALTAKSPDELVSPLLQSSSIAPQSPQSNSKIDKVTPSKSDETQTEVNGEVNGLRDVTRKTLPDPPKLAEIRADAEKSPVPSEETNNSNDLTKEEKRKLKNAKKKERRRLKKLEDNKPESEKVED